MNWLKAFTVGAVLAWLAMPLTARGAADEAAEPAPKKSEKTVKKAPAKSAPKPAAKARPKPKPKPVEEEAAAPETAEGEEEAAPAEEEDAGDGEDADAAEEEDAVADEEGEDEAEAEEEETVAEEPPPEPEEFKLVDIWAGKVIAGTLTAAPQRWRDFEGLLLDGKLRPEDKDERPTVERPPAEGKTYAILTVQVMPERSLGKHDYLLRTPEGDAPCLAMRLENEPFDPRVHQVKYGPDLPLVQLAFEVSAALRDVQVVSGLPLTLPPPPVDVRLLEEAVPEPTASDPAEGEAAPADDAAAPDVAP